MENDMPNWTSNTLDITGTPDSVDRFVDHMGDEMDFNKVIPQPDNLFLGNFGNAERKMCAAKGIPNWLDWNSENWGTKWNANNDGGSVEIEVYGGSEGFKQATYQFMTAWDTPRPVIAALWEQWPDLEFDGGYFHEGYEGCGSFLEFMPIRE
jgi:hypothetical protein|tara:strand:+ start:421 stop:876 length:456 start_codon:yes stop_codon:yes gene_type:complete